MFGAFKTSSTLRTKGSRAFLRILSTKGRSVRLWQKLSKLNGPTHVWFWCLGYPWLELLRALPFGSIVGLIKTDLGSGVYANAILWINSNTRFRTTLWMLAASQFHQKAGSGDPLQRFERKQGFLRILPTEGRGVYLCGGKSTPKGPEGSMGKNVFLRNSVSNVLGSMKVFCKRK